MNRKSLVVLFFTLIAKSTLLIAAPIKYETVYMQDGSGQIIPQVNQGKESTYTIKLTNPATISTNISANMSTSEQIDVIDFIKKVWNSNASDGVAKSFPNARLFCKDANENQLSMVMKLSNPTYDENTKTIFYQAKIIANLHEGEMPVVATSYEFCGLDIFSLASTKH